MEINFETKTEKAFQESFHQIRRAQLSMESVVPDVKDDIRRIYSIQPSVLLKSKDLTSRGASVSGEVTVALLYVNEEENAVSDLQMTQSFSLDYEIPEPDPEMLTQIRLFIGSTEARALNPRKVSVTLEICGELTGYQQEDVRTETCLPNGAPAAIYAKKESMDCILINAVCEKTFVINEQFPFPSGKPSPDRLVSQIVDFHISDQQLIGSKVLIKGSLGLSICYLSSECDYPVPLSFSSPFSQLVDIGQEVMDSCTVQIEPTSVYFNLLETIGGEKAIDAEIHAVVQIVSRFRQELSVLSDAYCSCMPSKLSFYNWKCTKEVDMERLRLEAEERFELPEDCADVLTILPSLSSCVLGNDKAELTVLLDVLYRSSENALSTMRRTAVLTAEAPKRETSAYEAKLLDCYLRPDNMLLSGRISAELVYMAKEDREVQSVSSMMLDEDNAYDMSSFPTVTAVRVDREDIWDLAKNYHSSCESIESLNDLDRPIHGRMLLVPKCT